MTEASGGRGKNRRTRKKGRPGKRARREGGSQRRRRANGRSRTTLFKAMAHPLRRRMLQVITEEGAPLSPAQLAKAFDLPVGLIAYHAAVLQGCGAVEVVAEEDG
jgi:hypothetical protein